MKINYANKKLASYIAPIGFILSVALAISLFLSSHKSDGASTTNSIELGAMEQVWQFVDKYFYDQNFNGVEWESILNRYLVNACLLYTSPSPRDQRGSRMPSSA